MAEASYTEGNPYRKKKKNKINQLVIMTKIDIASGAKQTYARDEHNNEFYILRHKCHSCGSIDNSEQTDTERSDVSCLEKKLSDNWLSDKEANQIDQIVEGEGDYRRRSRQKEQVVAAKRLNKLGMIDALRVQTLTRARCDRQIEQAKLKGDVSANLNAFLIMEDGTLRPYNAEHGGCLYELVRNKHRDEIIRIERLHLDMIRHQEAFKQLFHIFLYLERHKPRIEYLIYKRPIELIGNKLVDHLDLWDRIENLFEAKQKGHYYAVMGCLSFSPKENTVSDVYC